MGNRMDAAGPRQQYDCTRLRCKRHVLNHPAPTKALSA